MWSSRPPKSPHLFPASLARRRLSTALAGMGRISRLAVFIAVVCLAAGCTDDVLEASYDDRAEVEADGAIRHGWVPEWLPVNASNIREVHNIDTSESALAFSLPPGANWRPPPECRPAEGGEFSEPRFNRDWIPKPDSQTMYYSCPGEAGPGVRMVEAVAVSSGGQRVIHWRVFAR